MRDNLLPMNEIEPASLLDELASTRPIFHSEADFQHALAMLIARQHPTARLRLETRPHRGVHLISRSMRTGDGRRLS